MFSSEAIVEAYPKRRDKLNIEMKTFWKKHVPEVDSLV